MSSIREIREKGTEIIEIDLSEVHTEPREVYMKTLEKAEQVIASRARDSVLTLTRLNRLILSDMLMEDMKAYIAHNKPYVKKGAVLGIDGLNKVVFNTFSHMLGRKMLVFNTEQEALAWLTRE